MGPFAACLALLACLPLALSLRAQDDPGELLLKLKHQVSEKQLIPASETAGQLDAAIQARYREWLVRDSSERADEVLSWLPADMESFCVNRSPEEINGDLAFQTGIEWDMLDRVKAQEDGRFIKPLQGATVRMSMAAARAIPPPDFDMVSLPAPIRAPDVIYFHFLAAAAQIGEPTEVVDGVPLWRTTATIEDRQGGSHEDANWIAQPKADLLVISNRKDLLLSVVRQIASGGKSNRALPAVLSEWQYVDRSSAFWGLRHFSPGSRPQPGGRGCDPAELPFPGCDAIGATVRYDASAESLDIRYLGSHVTDTFARIGLTITQPRAGV
jgi:hypothetical protein